MVTKQIRQITSKLSTGKYNEHISYGQQDLLQV